MGDIKLDPRKLLGFRIIADGNASAMLHSPKIGGKGCAVTADDPGAAVISTAPLSANTGNKAN